MRLTPLTTIALLLTGHVSAVLGEVVELRPALVEKDGVAGIEYRSGGSLVGRSPDGAPAGEPPLRSYDGARANR